MTQPPIKKNKTTNSHATVDWEEQSKKIERYCSRKGFVVRYETCDQACSTICFVNKEIVIHEGSTAERRFYNLLHEMGHLLIHENHQAYARNTGFVLKNFSDQSLTQKVGEVEEEYGAWKVGYAQAKKMRLKVNRIEYEKLKASYLSTYFEWAIDRKIKKLVGNALKTAASKKKP